MKAMILAAGLGSRLKPWTDHHPKALATVNGRSLLERNIAYLQKAGIKELIINVHHFADQVIREIELNKGWGTHITISDETDTVMETGGGLKKAEWFFAGEKDMVLMNVDILTDLDITAMIQRHREEESLATLAVSDRESSRYFLFDTDQTLSGWRNVKTGEEKLVRKADPLIPKAFSGVHVISTAIFPLIQQTGKFSMVDVYLGLASSNRIGAFDHSGSRFIDVGKPESIAKAELLFP